MITKDNFRDVLENLNFKKDKNIYIKKFENFVVFESVCRLLNQGYNLEHIELEPHWQLGHGASGGRADILITDNEQTPLLIIECKTYGKEFDTAWRNTLINPTQLFSYAQQIRS